MQLQLHYITQHNTSLVTLHYATTTTTTATTTAATTTTTLHYTTLHCTTLHYITLHYTNYTTLRYNYNYTNCACNYTNYPTLQLQLHYTTLQLQLQLCYSILHPAVVVRWPLQPMQWLKKNTTPTTFRSICGFALPSVIHNNQSLL